MITFKQLRWGNAFSYGLDNVIQLDSSPLTQIVGKNGHGKSSIALIIEEVLFNQNSKKVKKADVLNRYTKDKNYTIELDFDKDGVEYSVKTFRTSTASIVKLARAGIDISSHTATGTYKTIEQILGYDHKTFSQIVYQSSVSSLEFLTATDTARKKFLIELLNLGVYTKAAEVFKALASDASKLVDADQTKINTVRSWLTKYEKEDLTIRELETELDTPVSLTAEIALKTNELANIDITNKKIIANNKYKELLNAIVLGEAPEAPPLNAYVTDLKVQLASAQKELKDGKALAAKCDGPVSVCSTCTQTIDNSTMYNMVKQFEHCKSTLEDKITKLTQEIKECEAATKAHEAYSNKILEVEKYHALIDPKLPDALQDAAELASDIKVLQASIDAIYLALAKTRVRNKAITEHNSRAQVIGAQMQDMKTELTTLSASLVQNTIDLTNLQVLVKAFSTTGLVAYKIECLVKDLESITNEYLSELADGRFQLSFKIAASDKLNVVITDNGRDVDIIALSSGERARVNVATLLAIRKLMQSLSNSRTNLLILDETISSLDTYGKERLIEILLAEENLNTFIVSHDFSHPLLEKLSVVKDKNISRLEAV